MVTGERRPHPLRRLATTRNEPGREGRALPPRTRRATSIWTHGLVWVTPTNVGSTAQHPPPAAPNLSTAFGNMRSPALGAAATIPPIPGSRAVPSVRISTGQRRLIKCLPPDVIPACPRVNRLDWDFDCPGGLGWRGARGDEIEQACPGLIWKYGVGDLPAPSPGLVVVSHARLIVAVSVTPACGRMRHDRNLSPRTWGHKTKGPGLPLD